MESMTTKPGAVLATCLVSAGAAYFFNKTLLGKKVQKKVEQAVGEKKSKVEQAAEKTETLEKKKVIPTVVVGPSGVGKGTLLTKLKEEYGSFAVAVSHTTRKPRAGETDGVSYNFVTRDEFKAMIKNNEFIEHAQYGEKMYGTSVKAVADVANSGKICLLEIDLQGAESIKALGMEARFIFITTSGDTLSILMNRLQERGSESEEQMSTRLETAKKELKFLEDNPKFFDFVLENDDLEVAYKRLVSKLDSWYNLQQS